MDRGRVTDSRVGSGILAVVLLLIALYVWQREGIDCAGGQCSTAGEIAGVVLGPLALIALVSFVAAAVAGRRSRRR